MPFERNLGGRGGVPNGLLNSLVSSQIITVLSIEEIRLACHTTQPTSLHTYTSVTVYKDRFCLPFWKAVTSSLEGCDIFPDHPNL